MSLSYLPGTRRRYLYVASMSVGYEQVGKAFPKDGKILQNSTVLDPVQRILQRSCYAIRDRDKINLIHCLVSAN